MIFDMHLSVMTRSGAHVDLGMPTVVHLVAVMALGLLVQARLVPECQA